MDVHIGEMNSTVSTHTTNAETLLSPQVLQQIVKAVLERLREEQAHEQRLNKERHICANIFDNDL